MNMKWVFRGLATAFSVVVALLILVATLVGRNDLHTWQIVQHWDGAVDVVNEPGWYWRGIAQVTTYSRQLEIFCTKKISPESPAEVRFNDGGVATEDWFCRVTTPQLLGDEDEATRTAIIQKQRDFHRQFRNEKNVANAARSHGRDCLSRSGAIMSSSENQAHRKAQFYEVVNGQFREGYYKMRPVTVRRKDSVSALLKEAERMQEVAQSKPGEEKKSPQGSSGPLAVQQPRDVVGEQSITATDTVLAAEIVEGKDGKPIIDNPSPLLAYGMNVLQFSVSSTEYDDGTQTRFTAKRDALLASEQSKADAVNQAQQQLTALAQGDREVAETEWKSNEVKAKALIEAETKQAVATIGQKLKEVQGQTLVKVAVVQAKTQECLRSTAETEAKIAENNRKATQIAAEAQEKKILLAGATSDHLKALWEIQLQQTEEVAKGLAGIQVPGTVIMSADAVPPGMSPLARALPAIQLLESFGLTQKPAEINPSKWKVESGASTATPAVVPAKSAPAPTDKK